MPNRHEPLSELPMCKRGLTVDTSDMPWISDCLLKLYATPKCLSVTLNTKTPIHDYQPVLHLTPQCVCCVTLTWLHYIDTESLK